MVIHVNLGPRSYDICLSGEGLHGLGKFARERCRGRLAIIVTDENVAPHAQRVRAELKQVEFRTHLIVLPPGEHQKALGIVAGLYDRFAELGADRRTLVIAVGGGVIGDLAGFVAATFTRGLALLMIPTTLLAMVDSSVGGKVGINHPKAKNLIGSFHQPCGVWIDTSTLATLPGREYRSGLAEVVKYGVILDAEFFAYLERNVAALLARETSVLLEVISRCCRLKAEIVEQDEREETGRRMVLNYGHTFAHAFETVAGYGAWLHGEAVAAGMICASRLAEHKGMIAPEITQRQRRLLEQLGLPTAPSAWPLPRILEVMRLDKKALADRLRFVLPRRLGEVAVVEDVSEEEVANALHQSTV